jgi:hypothetical protein
VGRLAWQVLWPTALGPGQLPLFILAPFLGPVAPTQPKRGASNSRVDRVRTRPRSAAQWLDCCNPPRPCIPGHFPDTREVKASQRPGKTPPCMIVHGFPLSSTPPERRYLCRDAFCQTIHKCDDPLQFTRHLALKTAFPRCLPLAQPSKPHICMTCS